MDSQSPSTPPFTKTETNTNGSSAKGKVRTYWLPDESGSAASSAGAKPPRRGPVSFAPTPMRNARCNERSGGATSSIAVSVYVVAAFTRESSRGHHHKSARRSLAARGEDRVVQDLRRVRSQVALLPRA